MSEKLRKLIHDLPHDVFYCAHQGGYIADEWPNISSAELKELTAARIYHVLPGKGDPHDLREMLCDCDPRAEVQPNGDTLIVHNFIKRTKPASSRIDEATREEIRTFHKQGRFLRETAKEFDVSHETVRKITK